MTSVHTSPRQYGILAIALALTAFLVWVSFELFTQSRQTSGWLLTHPTVILTSSAPGASTLWNPVLAALAVCAALVTAWSAASLIAAELAVYAYRQGHEIQLFSLVESRALSPLVRPLIHRRIAVITAAMSLCATSPSIAADIPDDLSWAPPTISSTTAENSDGNSPTVIDTLRPEQQLTRKSQPVTQARIPLSRQYTVQKGDSLWAIAARHLKTTEAVAIDTYWRSIYDLNREVIGHNPHMIFPGQTLELPERGPQ